ncbi:MAG: hypothetical protein ACRD1H_15440 [Vicinamibacterales bacterium]
MAFTFAGTGVALARGGRADLVATFTLAGALATLLGTLAILRAGLAGTLTAAGAGGRGAGVTRRLGGAGAGGFGAASASGRVNVAGCAVISGGASDAAEATPAGFANGAIESAGGNHESADLNKIGKLRSAIVAAIAAGA